MIDYFIIAALLLAFFLILLDGVLVKSVLTLNDNKPTLKYWYEGIPLARLDQNLFLKTRPVECVTEEGFIGFIRSVMGEDLYYHTVLTSTKIRFKHCVDGLIFYKAFNNFFKEMNRE